MSPPHHRPALSVHCESWPLAGVFAIARGAKTRAELVVAEVRQDEFRGRGECVPYAHYGESVEGVAAALEALARPLALGLTREQLPEALEAGAARNALDCALWDLEAKRRGIPAHRLAGLEALHPVTTAYTLSLDTPEKMGAAARRNAHRPLLKIKLAGEGDLERVAAIRRGAPASTLIVDANEGWPPPRVEPLCAALARLGVALIEQPLPAGRDHSLANFAHPVALCADESCHTTADLEAIAGRYEVINIKLDKTGGLSAALELKEKARAAGLGLMVGCMVGTSLGMAPALLLAQEAQFVDLDGPLLLARDREEGLVYEDSLVHPPGAALWG